MSKTARNLSIEEVSRLYNYPIDELKIMADRTPLPHIKQYPGAGQIVYLFPADELARKLFARPVETAAPPPRPQPKEEPESPPLAIYPSAKPTPKPAVEEKPAPVKKTSKSTKK